MTINRPTKLQKPGPKALGFNAVSFYTLWGLHEYKRDKISFDGFLDLQPFFDAAKEAGIYLIARPGPYVNAEASGGGFPGWGTHTEGLWRTQNATYVEAMTGYIKAIGAKIAENQITKGGPVILVQAENEYSGFQAPYTEDFEYEKILLEQFRASGITVPITTNDAWPGGHFTSVDIYGTQGYECFRAFSLTFHKVTTRIPMALIVQTRMCGLLMLSPSMLSFAMPPLTQRFLRYFWGSHLDINPQAPNAVWEYQGGAFDPWGGAGYEGCATRLGPEFERGVYTSYDYGSAIAEDRTLREKYYEIKLQASFLAVTPAYLTSRPQNIYATQGSFTGNTALKTTQILDVVGNKTGFYIVRQTDASSTTPQTYTLTVATSIGTLTIPTISGVLTLNGRDSKIHVVDYAAGSTNVLYSTAEILTWVTIDSKDVLLVYGNAGELHETAFTFSGTPPTAEVLSGSGSIKQKIFGDNHLALQFTTTGQTVVRVGSTLLYILDRTNAYQFWVLHPPTSGNFASYSTENPIIVKGGYLVRSVDVKDSTLAIKGDLNGTATFEIIAPAASSEKSVTFNGEALKLSKTPQGTLTAKRSANLPEVRLPNLSLLVWKTADSLPEIKIDYSDAKWTVADHTTTINPTTPTTPVVLFAGDYGYHTGNILWRGHLNATGTETAFSVQVQGGSAFGFSVWLDSTFIGSWEGDAAYSEYTGTFQFPSFLEEGSAHVLTILQDHMGYEEDWWAAGDDFKIPRGILNYTFFGESVPIVNVWKVTGNLGGESFADKTRGGLNEGGLYGERQGWHLPGFDDVKWAVGKPTIGISAAGVSFYRTTFDLNVPVGVDYPLALVVGNSTTNPHSTILALRNHSQFVSDESRTTAFVDVLHTTHALAQGILNYNGQNTLAVSLWTAGSEGGKLESLDLELTAKVETGRSPVVNAPLTPWSPRLGAY
ncbi:hypothetical protein C0995_007006 [Termitomyces sp. Mi166|nr:hypothetical protein C0995_007006 [Termitomyces sp. Mi166\